SGDDYVGGLVGRNEGSITSCYSAGWVSGDSRVGGLVGRNGGGSITSCYSTGSVSGRRYVGGLVGDNDHSSITTCYSTGSVSGNSYIGGLVGRNGRDSTVTMSYSTGIVFGTGYSVGGLIGSGWGGSTVTFCFWDMETSGLCDSEGGTGLTTAEMQTASTFATAGWGCNPVWTINEDNDHPRLWWENKVGQPIDSTLSEFLEGEGTEVSPYLIYTVEDASIMANFPCEWDKQFRMMFLIGEGTPENPYLIHTADDIEILNAAPYLQNISFRLTFVAGEGTQENPYLIYNPEEMNLLRICPYEQDAYHRLGFIAGEGIPESPYQIYSTDELDLMGQSPHELNKHFKLMADIDLSGVIYSEAVIPIFKGKFDGNGLMISNLTIAGGRYLGLFGRLESGAEVKNLGVVDVNIADTGDNVGGLAGENRGDVTGCYSTGSVSGDSCVGGLVGDNYGSITACYSTSAVSGDRRVGGLVGENDGSITNSYSTGAVSGDDNVGGLVGYNYNGGRITTSYSTGTVSGSESVGGLVGYNAGEVIHCNSSAKVSGDRYAGGLVGYNSVGTVINSYSTGSVESDDVNDLKVQHLYVLTSGRCRSNCGILEVSLAGDQQIIVDGRYGSTIKIKDNILYTIRGGDIVAYDLEGRYLRTIPTPPQADDYLDFVALPGEKFALLDNENDKVLFSDDEGNVIATTSIRPVRDDRAQNLNGIVVDNRLIVSEDGDGGV
ncbi:MAG: GLUG motif-containing protein, partial [Planctomycetota bacterium]